MYDLPEPKDDGRIIQEVGDWTQYKHHFLSRYMQAFLIAMKDKPWNGLHYIDMFAGCGLARLRKSGKLVWGSPLIAAQMSPRFTKLHLCERDPVNCEALSARVRCFRPDARIVEGDATEKVPEIVEQIPARALSLAFLDPYGLPCYEILRTLSVRRSDLIIFFPDHLDALRNLKTYYWENPTSKLDSCFGPDVNWRKRLEDVPAARRVQQLRHIYQEQLSRLGYKYFEPERISMPGGQPLYLLILCSRSKTAAEIWRRTSEKKANGQRTFRFED